VTAEEFIALAGGELDRSSLPASMPLDQFELVQSWLSYIQELVDAFCKGAKCAPIRLALTHLPSIVCRVRVVQGGSAVIVIPAGLIVRTTLFARLLLRYFDQEANMRFANSILDDVPESDWLVAPALIPLLSELPDESRHWVELARFQVNKPNESMEGVVPDILWVATAYLVWHEVMHVARRHFAFVETMRTNSGKAAQYLNEDTVRRGLEVEADAIAAEMLVFTALEKFGSTVEELAQSAFFWIGYTLPLLFGLYDTRRKALNLYAARNYPHPIVRRRLAVDFVTTFLSNDRPELLKILGGKPGGRMVRLRQCTAPAGLRVLHR